MHSLEKKNLESDNDKMLVNAPVDGSNDDLNEADLNAFLAV